MVEIANNVKNKVVAKGRVTAIRIGRNGQAVLELLVRRRGEESMTYLFEYTRDAGVFQPGDYVQIEGYLRAHNRPIRNRTTEQTEFIYAVSLHATKIETAKSELSSVFGLEGQGTRDQGIGYGETFVKFQGQGVINFERETDRSRIVSVRLFNDENTRGQNYITASYSKRSFVARKRHKVTDEVGIIANIVSTKLDDKDVFEYRYWLYIDDLIVTKRGNGQIPPSKRNSQKISETEEDASVETVSEEQLPEKHEPLEIKDAPKEEGDDEVHSEEKKEQESNGVTEEASTSEEKAEETPENKATEPTEEDEQINLETEEETEEDDSVENVDALIQFN